MFHNVCLSHLIQLYDDERKTHLKPKIKTKVVHTNNCMTQYKCHQSFYHIATCAKTHQSRVIQKCAETICFKGNWDATEKLIKYVILKNEKKSDRRVNALDYYYKLKRDLNTNGQQESDKI